MKRDRAPAESDPRWAAVQRRDPSATFFYSVATTGVYCRPACASRRPNPRNVAFHATAAEAEQAGFRACQRCRPDEPSLEARRATLVADLCRYIETAEDPPALKDLAARAGLSPHHTHRMFKAVTGVTPRAYAAAHRAARVRDTLRGRASVTEAIYEAGFNSSARFYENARALLGMTPRAYRAGGQGTTIRFAVGQTSLGALCVAATPHGVCSVALGDDPEALVQDLQRTFAEAELVGGDAAFEGLVAWVAGLVERPWTSPDLPLHVHGTAFQHRVWSALTRIPPGETLSYAEVARAIGAPTAARAVARACASNPVAIAIPCHRIVRQDGALSGYRWGVETKAALLAREAEAPTIEHPEP